ncbi:hypothetical protein AVEN_94778-1 [Araneus ventricosus]|uniref:Uncharacterized protein n=1 Tax=Araneus ventricosus TaxID=182803 RepID=A0A4Y2CM55_ARAVE|nr:hypothetical protein AVEN_94778-1 [Araneus ventricosus]
MESIKRNIMTSIIELKTFKNLNLDKISGLLTKDGRIKTKHGAPRSYLVETPRDDMPETPSVSRSSTTPSTISAPRSPEQFYRTRSGRTVPPPDRLYL